MTAYSNLMDQVRALQAAFTKLPRTDSQTDEIDLVKS